MKQLSLFICVFWYTSTISDWWYCCFFLIYYTTNRLNASKRGTTVLLAGFDKTFEFPLPGEGVSLISPTSCLKGWFSFVYLLCMHKPDARDAESNRTVFVSVCISNLQRNHDAAHVAKQIDFGDACCRNQHKADATMCFVCIYIYLQRAWRRGTVAQNACLMTENGASMAASSIQVSSNEWLCDCSVEMVSLAYVRFCSILRSYASFFLFNAVASLSYVCIGFFLTCSMSSDLFRTPNACARNSCMRNATILTTLLLGQFCKALAFSLGDWLCSHG
jgi:hypothetical protein